MQSLPITAMQAAVPAQQAASADGNTAQPAEPFGNVLARQRASADTAADAADSKQAASAAGRDASAASGDTQPGVQAPAPDTTSMLPAGLIPGALLPAEATSALPALPDTDRAARSEKTDPWAPTPDALTALPGAIAAVALHTSTAGHGAAADEKDRPDATAALPGSLLGTLAPAAVALQKTDSSMRPQTPVPSADDSSTSGAADISGMTQVTSRTGQSAQIRDALSLPRTQASAGSTTAATPSAQTQASTFSAALEAMSKESTKALQPDTSSKELPPLAAPSDPAINPAILTHNSATSIAPVANVPMQASVNTPVAHDAWGEDFGQKITWLATQNTQNAELHLNPPQLGPLDVVLNISGDQATALFTSPHAAVRDAVEQALPRLREMLADNGIMLGNTMVSDQSPKEQQAWLASQQQNGSGNLPGKVGGAAATDSILSGSAVLPVRRHQGMVDTFA